MEIYSPTQHENIDADYSSYPPLNDNQSTTDYQSTTSLQEPNASINPINVKGFDFSDESIRRGFIRKVYGLLSVNKT